MSLEKDYLKDLSDIRVMMERSSRFISLSGLSGIFAGAFAIIGAVVAYIYLNLGSYANYYDGAFTDSQNINASIQNSVLLNVDFICFASLDALCVFVLSISVGYILTSRKAKKEGLKVWDKSAKQLVTNLFIPLVAGGLFCGALLYHGLIGLIAPATLLFYGLALVNGSKFTLDDVRYLGYCEILLGVIATFMLGYGLVFWVIGFGLLHIIYGTSMYYKYERKK